MTTYFKTDDYRDHAADLVKPDVWDFIEGGAGDETTIAANRKAFTDTVLNPRRMVDVSNLHTSVDLFGRWAAPLGIAPTALHTLVDPEGELATVRAAQRLGLPMVVSTMAHHPIEDIASELHRAADKAGQEPAPLWSQIYIFRDREVTRSLIKRSQSAGASAIVVTIDSPWLGRRLRDLRNDFHMPAHVHPGHLAKSLGADPGFSAPSAHAADTMDPSLAWDDLTGLTSLTDLPLIAKGVMTGADARLAVDAGAAGVLVSNHGGRQLDRGRATLHALPEIVAAVDGQIPVLLDGGVRDGADILIAAALGAKAVLVGRPVLHGLAAGGEDGARGVLSLLLTELTNAMGQTGQPDIDRISPSLVANLSA